MEIDVDIKGKKKNPKKDIENIFFKHIKSLRIFFLISEPPLKTQHNASHSLPQLKRIKATMAIGFIF
jgi:hypothetical protein